jgi:hypothetical protein
MNSGGASTGGLRDATRPLEREEPARARDGEASAQLWTALAQSVTSAQRLPLAAIEPTSGWRTSAGNLTPLAGTAVGLGGAPADASAPERMVVRVDGGELGELEVTLERDQGELRVVIGLEKGHLVSSVEPDARALRAALEGAGLTVRSLNVVPTSEVGTVLAERHSSSSGPKPLTEPTSSEPDPETARKRNPKRLTLIG